MALPPPSPSKLRLWFWQSYWRTSHRTRQCLRFFAGRFQRSGITPCFNMQIIWSPGAAPDRRGRLQDFAERSILEARGVCRWAALRFEVENGATL